MDESLTTPVPREEDIAFPGENWFFYWKTAASLWKNKILERGLARGAGHRLIVPINWAFHSDTGDTFDFAKLRPETDLLRLVQVARDAHCEMVFLFPLTPMPFLPNGGIPSLLARNQAISSAGTAQVFVDNEMGLNKMFSFYDPRIYEAYYRFANAFGNYLSSSGITNNVYGLSAYIFDDFGYRTCMHDRGRVFNRAFERFLGAGNLASANKMYDKNNNRSREELLKCEFEDTTCELYLQAACEGIGPNWEGEKKFFFLGGNEEDLLKRSFDVDSKVKYCLDLFRGLEYGIGPSSVLLPSRVKRGVLTRALHDVVSMGLQEELFESHITDASGKAHFLPLNLFHLYTDNHNDNHNNDSFSNSIWDNLHLKSYLDKFYAHTKRIHDFKKFNFLLDELDEGAIYFFDGKNLTKEYFKTMLKIFMSGGKVIFNRNGLPLELLMRLEAFFLENSLKVTKINSETMIYNIVLGAGRLVIFEGDKLKDKSKEILHQFWERLLNTFEIVHFNLSNIQDVDFFWMKREAGNSEMNYEEIRRLSFYNPTSYKKKIRFRHIKPFMLLKIVDALNAKVESAGQEIEILMLPDSSVSLDFGVYS